MPIEGLDHVTVCTRDTAATVAFWRDVVGLEPGPRPRFSFGGAWLYCRNVPVVHIVEREAGGGGVIDHVALRASDLAAYRTLLEDLRISYDLRPLPEGVAQSGNLQLFFHDPNGVRIELTFARGEDRAAPVRSSA
jgi:catechol 2,3-dioxygenase-like lactoylglutathione lyase family enzyme